MPDAAPREIPYNYTSADDEQVVRQVLGGAVWRALEGLRAKRVTGRSAKLLMRFIGDLFILRRNPYLFQEMMDSASRRRDFLKAARADLAVVDGTAGGNKKLLVVLRRCREKLDALTEQFTKEEARRGRIRHALGAVVGEANVLFDPFALISHATDATDWRLYLPLAVARPSEESQVAPLLSAIGRLGLKAIPRGAGTGLTGGAVPLAPDCVMVNTEKLNRIRGIQPVDLDDGAGRPRPVSVMEVESGVITEDAIRFARKEKLVFATDPTSAWACTIGGNLAENAGGKTAVLWGTCIDNVLSWRLATPLGGEIEVARLSHPLRKILPEDKVTFVVRDVRTGEERNRVTLAGSEIRKKGLWKDITNKALGGVPGLQKEGTDGVVTSAKFILHRAYPLLATACLEFYGADFDEASRVIWALSQEFVNRGEETLMALEHFDDQYVRAIGYRNKAARTETPKAVLLIDLVAFNDAQLARGKDRLEKLLEPYANTELFTAKDPAEGELFWKDRKKFGAIAKRTNAFKLNEDTVLPLDRLADFARYVEGVNVEEERHNQAQLVEALAAHLAGLGGDGDSFLAPKLPAARALAEKAQAALKAASPAELRGQIPVLKLREGLRLLYAGYGAVEEALEKRHQEVRSRQIVIATHMHAGDGNVHVNIPVFSNDRDMMRRAAGTADRVMEEVKGLGGVVSGEHGIGITKLKYLEPGQVRDLEDYRRFADPGGLMNPLKLSDLGVLDLVYTPSFNLLELEARILRHGSLEKLADMISKCVRCGKCKPNCCVFHPGSGLFYHPRNKNLAVAAIIEALLYEAQRFHTTEFKLLRHLGEVSDHCTICHKCLKPCPVDIDTGEVSVLEREILAERGFKRTPAVTRLTLKYLASRSRVFNALFRTLVVRAGGAAQRLGARALRLVPAPGAWRDWGPLRLLKSPVPAAAASPLSSYLPKCRPNQALLLNPERPNGKSVFYFPGCGSERLFSDIGLASIHNLLQSGTRVVLPPPALCCGFPQHANAQTQVHDRQVLADTILFSQIREMFGYLDFDGVAVSCGTCREALKSMGAEGIFQAPLVDVSKFALESGLPKPPAGNYLYHQPCHDSLDEKALPVMRAQAGWALRAVPHCCSEAGTLALSRPDLSGKMLDRKAEALGEALGAVLPAAGKDPVMLTNCPSCVQGLGRQERLGVRAKHMAVELAEKTGGRDWMKNLAGALAAAEVVNF